MSTTCYSQLQLNNIVKVFQGTNLIQSDPINQSVINFETHHLQVSVCQSQRGKSQNVVVALSPAVGCKVLLPEWHPVRIPRLRHSRLWTIPELGPVQQGIPWDTMGYLVALQHSTKLTHLWTQSGQRSLDLDASIRKKKFYRINPFRCFTNPESFITMAKLSSRPTGSNVDLCNNSSARPWMLSARPSQSSFS